MELIMSLLLSDLIVAKQLPATAGSPKSFLNISWVWNIYFLFLIKMNLKEKACIDCFIRQENHNLNKKAVKLN